MGSRKSRTGLTFTFIKITNDLCSFLGKFLQETKWNLTRWLTGVRPHSIPEFLLLKKNLFIYLATQGLSCSTQDL